MSLRARLLLAFSIVVLIPLVLLAFGLRYTMTTRLSDEYARRLEAVRHVIDEDLQRESRAIADRLASLDAALQRDNLFRRGAVADDPSARDYVLDYAGTAMRLTGLAMLQIQDDEGRIISSGHFRNEHGRLEPELPSALAARAHDVVLVTARTPEGEFLALARAAPLRIGGSPFTLIGGIAVDQSYLQQLTRDQAIVVSLVYAGGGLSSAPAADLDDTPPDHSDEAAVSPPLRIPVLRTSVGAPFEVLEAELIVRQPLTPLRALLHEADTWFLATAAGASVTALVLAVWVSSRISRPLADLAEKTAVLDLDRLDVQFHGGTDEVGRLAQLLGDLATRLRTSTARIREVERRATVGDLARQINHDIKNGLIPLRNVMRHLAQVGRDEPGAVAAVLDERRQTIDSSIAYLETLATHYERLSPAPHRHECALNPLVDEVVRGALGYPQVELHADLSPQVSKVVGDPVAIRRVLENLVANAIDSLDSQSGRVTISTQLVREPDELPLVRIVVADTGRGMSNEEASRIFNDFYTTKPGGTGLGLSIVRRLVMDLRGTLRVQSEPGRGTRMIVEIPATAAAPARTAAGGTAAAGTGSLRRRTR